MRNIWFAATLRLVILIEGTGSVSEDLVAHTFRAPDWDGALLRALELGRGHERDYLNNDSVQVRRRLDRVVTLDMLRTDELDGAEVFSAMSDIAPDLPFNTTFERASHRPGQWGI